VEIDISTIRSQPNDTFLLCSDGLSDMLSDEYILSIVQACKERPLQDSGERLIDKANPGEVEIISRWSY
jgi:protein phosphatase